MGNPFWPCDISSSWALPRALGRAAKPAGTAFAALALAGCGDPSQQESMLGSVKEPSLCGANDMQHVESYDGSLGPSVSFVAAHERPVGNLKWKTDLSSRYTNPGNVAGVRWCSVTMISPDLLLTAGHCFDEGTAVANGWSWPKNNG